MTFELFAHLYDETFAYNACDMYIAERGWQEWMDPYNDAGKDIGDLLTLIWDIAHMDFKAMRSALSLSQIAMSQLYSMPRRTLENWDSGTNDVPPYITKLIAYTVFNCSNGDV